MRHLNSLLATDSTPWASRVSLRAFCGGLFVLLVALGLGRAPARVQRVAAGSYHTLAIHADGTLWAWGQNSEGQLGDGTTIERRVPVQVGTATNWKSVAAGDRHTVALRKDGTLWTWGANYFGSLGDSTTTERHVPVQVGTATTWKSISTDDYSTMALRKDGTLWTWGGNFAGQLGARATFASYVPIQVGTATNWKSIAAGYCHTVALRTDGTLWAWGGNAKGELGESTKKKSSHTPIQVGTATNWKSIAAGSDHTVALRKDGTLWTWGSNEKGQLGDGTTTDRHMPGQYR